MDIFDYLLFFIYALFFHFLYANSRKKITDPAIRKYHLHGYWIKVAGALAYCVFILGNPLRDTLYLYYPTGINIAKVIMRDFSNIKILFTSGLHFDEAILGDSPNVGYLQSDSNFLVTKIVAVLSFLCFGKFMAINLMFSLIAFSGIWKLFMFFYESYPKLHRGFAIALIYLPNLIFWTSGIMKDPLCMAALGWITYATCHFFFASKGKFKNLLRIIFWSYLLIVIKIYIFVSYFPLLMLFILITYLRTLHLGLKKVSILTVLLTVLVLLAVNASYLSESLLADHLSGNMAETVMSYQETYSKVEDRSGSNFSLGVDFDGSASSFLKLAPAGLGATLFRPFLWESRKAISLAASIEGLLLMLFTLYVLIRVGIFSFVKTIFKQPILLYCVGFAVAFSIFIGITTLNFGSLVRYKTPAISFYIIALILVLFYNGKIKSIPPVNPEFFTKKKASPTET